MISFSLYHGTSSHYFNHFQPRISPAGWPHKEVALALLREAWATLRELGTEPDWHIKQMLQQTSEHSNWQHGDLYVTPSKLSAVRYAGSNSAYGGELLTGCKNALNLLAQYEHDKADSLLVHAESVAHLLNGNGTPILIEITNVCADDLLPENPTDDVADMLLNLADLDDRMRDLCGQQMNFRLKESRGIVERVYHLEIEDPNNPISFYSMTEITT